MGGASVKNRLLVELLLSDGNQAFGRPVTAALSIAFSHWLEVLLTSHSPQEAPQQGKEWLIAMTPTIPSERPASPPI